ncbi:MAG: DUF4389 domain-containing protein [Gammaproteobacteria bacterium]|nr:DUF4389 domain-containing protein [Gammaproteobacteria bacterium]
MNPETKVNLKNSNTWTRILYMLIFVFVYGFAEIVFGAIVLFQVVLNLFTRSSNRQLCKFGGQLSWYIYNILMFLTYNTETKPFPFSAWIAEYPIPGQNKQVTQATDSQ